MRSKNDRHFLSIHNHSVGSLRDGLQTIENMCSESAKHNMTFALTEHGSLATMIEFYKYSRQYGIKFVPGNEIYINKNRDRLFWLRNKIAELKNKKSSSKEEEKNIKEELISKTHEFEEIKKYNHLVVIAKNNFGLKNLFTLNNKAYLSGFYGKPLNNHDDLLSLPRDKNGDRGLIVSSACLASESSRYLVNGAYGSALEYCKMMLEEFRDDFYLELQANELPQQKVVNEGLIEISKELSIPLIVGTDAHYLDVSYSKAHQVFLLIQGDQKYSDIGKKQWRIEYEKEGIIKRKKIELEDDFFGYKPKDLKEDQILKKEKIKIRKIKEVDKVWMIESADLTFKNEKQIRALMAKHDHLKPYIDQCIENNKDIFQKIDEINLDTEIKLPTKEDDFETLKERCIQSLIEKGLNKNIKYAERLKYELNIIEKSGFAGLMLILEDIFNYAKENEIPIGPARGSSGASLVAYLLGITRIDPIYWDLDFARFMTPERADSGKRVRIHLDDGQEIVLKEFDRIKITRQNKEKIIKAKDLLENDVIDKNFSIN